VGGADGMTLPMITKLPLRAMVPGLLGLLALCLTTFAVVHSEWNTTAAIESLMLRRVSAFAEIGVIFTRAGIGEGSPRVTRSYFEGLGNVPQFRFAALLDDGGHVVHASDSKGPLSEMDATAWLASVTNLIARSRGSGATAVSVLAEGDAVGCTAPVELPGLSKGNPWTVVILLDLTELKRAARADLLRSAAWMSGVALFAPLLVWWYFVTQVHAPVRRLQETLARLSRGSFDARSPLSGPPELLQLAESVNEMARELESREAELQKARGDLEESEKCLAMALRAASQGVLQCDLETGTLRVSTWIAERLGWLESASATSFQEWIARVHPEDRGLVSEMVEGHRGGRMQHRLEHRIRTATGSWEWVACETRLVAPGSPLRIAGSLQFITERKESYLLLVAQSQLLEFIAAGRPLPEILAAILRFAEAEVEGSRCSMMTTPDGGTLHPVPGGSMSEDFLRCIDGLPIAEGSAVCGTAAFRRQRVVVSDVRTDPACAPFLGLAEQQDIVALWSTPILRADGRVLGTFAMYFRESVRPTSRQEQILRIATHMAAFAIQRSQDDADLRESEARFRYLADTAPVMIWMCDAQGRTTFLSRPWLDFVGDPSGEATGEAWRERIHPEDRLLCESIWRHSLGSGRRFELQYRLRRHDGEFRWLLSSGVPRTDESGELVGFLGCAIDITGQRALEDHVRQSQKMESIGRLAAGVAHDFNNILTVILGNTALLPGAGPSEISRSADEITSAAERAARLTRQLLLFSRQQPFQPRRVDVDALIRGFLGMMTRLLGEDIRVEYISTGSLPAVEADPGLIEQVLLNLAANSRDAMPSGGRFLITATVVDLVEGPELVQLRPGRHVRVDVEDTGPGIPAEVLARVFDPFFTTKDVGKGTGLGLATAYGILQQHGGRIAVESPPGRGARFVIHLPVSLAGDAVEAQAEMSVVLPHGSERILVVEDDPGLLSLARSFLTRHGYHVSTAASGVEAMDLWRRTGPVYDLVVTDMVMPGGIGGLQLGEMIRSECPDLPVIHMSGYSREFAAAAGSGLAPGVEFLQKPFAMSELVRLVRHRLDRSQSRP
jgi:PAS domain S-box-containing protein